jgi:hypothetical protein
MIGVSLLTAFDRSPYADSEIGDAEEQSKILPRTDGTMMGERTGPMNLHAHCHAQWVGEIYDDRRKVAGACAGQQSRVLVFTSRLLLSFLYSVDQLI